MINAAAAYTPIKIQPRLRYDRSRVRYPASFTLPAITAFQAASLSPNGVKSSVNRHASPLSSRIRPD